MILICSKQLYASVPAYHTANACKSIALLLNKPKKACVSSKLSAVHVVVEVEVAARACCLNRPQATRHGCFFGEIFVPCWGTSKHGLIPHHRVRDNLALHLVISHLRKRLNVHRIYWMSTQSSIWQPLCNHMQWRFKSSVQPTQSSTAYTKPTQSSTTWSLSNANTMLHLGIGWPIMARNIHPNKTEKPTSCARQVTREPKGTPPINCIWHSGLNIYHAFMHLLHHRQSLP